MQYEQYGKEVHLRSIGFEKHGKCREECYYYKILTGLGRLLMRNILKSVADIVVVELISQ